MNRTKSIQKEHEANIFALTLLMPEKHFLYEYNRVKNLVLSEKKLIRSLSRIFGVPEFAVKWRLIMLRLK